MADIFLNFNASGIIQDIFFNHLSIKPHQVHSVYTLFDESTNDLIRLKLSQFDSDFKAITSNETFPTIILRSATQNYFLYVSSIQFSEPEAQTIIHLIDLLVDDYSSKKTLSYVDTKGFYEQMQILNNELVNKSRMIEKMNRQLYDLNIKQEELLRTDPLTQLISRYGFPQQINTKIAEYPGKKGLFCYLDIDDFKRVNDTFGHQAGDDYLVEFAKRLNDAPIAKSLKMRIAGDEFGIFIYDLDEVTMTHVESVWSILHNIVANPIEIGKLSLPVAFSAGFAVFPDDSRSIHLLFDDADKAMYIAKRKGKNSFACYNCVKTDL